MEPENQQQKNLSKEQKIAFSFLLLIGILAVGLGFLQIRNNIFSPFVIKPDFNSGPSAAQFFKDSETRLQKIDTDKDGLNDYEEINFHNTSRFIPDTDSDGIDDGEEIKQGSDPLCPEGKNCDNTFSNQQKKDKEIESSISSPSTTAASILGNARKKAEQVAKKQNDENENPASSSKKSYQASNTNIQNLLNNPDKLREVMKKNSNISAEKIEKIDDKTLIKVTKDILQKQGNIK